MTNPSPTVAVHGNSFHADDVFAAAVLMALHPGATLIRTRDMKRIAAADFAIDVGGEWDPARGRFDHHQKGFAEHRPSGVVYASSGLVWLAHGLDLIRQRLPGIDEQIALRVRDAIDDELVQHLDMADTGALNAAPGYFGISAMVSAFNTSRSEEGAAGAPPAIAALELAQFKTVMGFMGLFIDRLMVRFSDKFAGESLVRQGELLADGKILVLKTSGLSWSGVVCAEMPDVLFVVYPETPGGQHQVRVAPIEPQSFVARRDLPSAWAGLRNQDLAAVTGVDDAVFCHNNLFIAGAGSLAGAIGLAQAAVAQLREEGAPRAPAR
ncbi:MYG1 family protein [Variovorax paradoxus]|uniref:MYG1 family protein n=1 Tax=Variovorax paradoxus TaxID=34073 RepID=UPI00193310D2|nr:MYG1 family protein [Variovorax paradoxus]